MHIINIFRMQIKAENACNPVTLMQLQYVLAYFLLVFSEQMHLSFSPIAPTIFCFLYLSKVE